MNTPIYKRFYNRLCSKFEINPNTILIGKVIKKISCHLLNQVIDNDIYYKNKEHIKSYYPIQRSKPKLKKLLALFNNYAHIYPNYSLLPEAKIFYKNINHKQMLINQYEQIEQYKDKDKDKQKSNRLKKKDLNKTTFFDFSVLKELYNTSIFGELFYNTNRGDYHNNHKKIIYDRDDKDDIEVLIRTIEKYEKFHMTNRINISTNAKPKFECNISGFWINDQRKYMQSQSKHNKMYLITDSANTSKYSSTIITKQKQKPKMTQINIKLNSYKNKPFIQTSFNTHNMTHTPYYNKTLVTSINDSNNNSKNNANTMNSNRNITNNHSNNHFNIRTAILASQSISSRSLNSKKQMHLIRNNPLSKPNTNTNANTIAKSPRFITTNTSLLNYKKSGLKYPTANTSRITTIPSLKEALKLKVPLTNLKLNSKVMSRIKLKIAKQKGLNV